MARIQRCIGLFTPFLDVMPTPILMNASPTATDRDYDIGQVWIYKNGNTRIAYIFAGLDSSRNAVWALASPGASEVATLTADSGGAISPNNGDIVIAGGTNITTSGAASTITINLDAAITLATSVTVPLITPGAGVDLTIKMGDAAGANKISFTDSGNAEVASIDSNGNTVVNDLTVNGSQTFGGGITVNGGVINLNTDNAANAVNIGLGTVARTISIGNSAAAHVVAIGSTTGAASVTLHVGAGNFVLDGVAGSTYTIGASTTTGTITIGGTAQTGNFIIGTSSGIMTMNICDGNGAKTLDIASGVSGNQITIGNGINTSSQTITIAGGASGATSTLNLLTGNASAGTITLNAATGNRSTAVNIGTGTGGNTILIGSGINGSAQTISLGSGASGAAQTVNILSGNATAGTQTLNLATGTGGKTVHIADASAVNLVTIGSSSGASSLTLQAGSGNFLLTSAGTTFIDGTGAVTIDSSGGAINIGEEADNQAVNIGTAGTRTVTVGTTTSTSSLVLQAGTGGITTTGTFANISSKISNASGFSYTLSSSPTTCTAANTGGAATGTTGAVNLLGMQKGIIMEQFVLGAGQTIIKPVMTSSGLLISGDLTNTSGYEYNFGGALSNNPFAFNSGTSAAFFFQVSLTVATVAGGNPYMIGFRRTEANNATLANYNSYALIGMNNAVSSTNISLLTELNAGGQVTTNTTNAWADAATKTLKVLVDASGNVTYTINGSPPSVTAAFAFTGGFIITPVIYVLHNASAGTVNLVDWACGFQ